MPLLLFIYVEIIEKNYWAHRRRKVHGKNRMKERKRSTKNSNFRLNLSKFEQIGHLLVHRITEKKARQRVQAIPSRIFVKTRKCIINFNSMVTFVTACLLPFWRVVLLDYLCSFCPVVVLKFLKFFFCVILGQWRETVISEGSAIRTKSTRYKLYQGTMSF